MWNHAIWADPATVGYWEAQSKFSDTVLNTTTGGSGHPECSTVQLVFTRTVPATVTDDVMVTSFSFCGPNVATATSVLLTADKATIEGFLNTWWTTEKAYHPSSITLKEYRWHDYLDVSAKPGPAVRITTVNVAATGSATATMPDQNAVTHTFRTCSRRHWGRIYLPKMTNTNYDGYGRLIHSVVDGSVGATRTLFNAAIGANIEPVVVSRAYKAVLTISELACDNTGDVVRRRRSKHPEYIKTFTS